MLVISKRSWHYRLYRRWYGGSTEVPNENYVEPKNLCFYFWSITSIPLQVVGGCVIWFVSRPLLLGKTPGAIVLSAAFSSLVTMWAFLNPRGLLTFAAILSVIVGACVLAIVITVVAVDYRERRRERNDGTAKADRAPGLLSLAWKFIVARKQRVCPLIQVKP